MAPSRCVLHSTVTGRHKPESFTGRSIVQLQFGFGEFDDASDRYVRAKTDHAESLRNSPQRNSQITLISGFS